MFVLIGVHTTLDAADNVWMNTLILLAILVGYAGLLGAVAVFIVRKGSVLHDARTPLIALALVAGAASVALDELLTRDTVGGFGIAACAMAVLILICEFVRRGLRFGVPDLGLALSLIVLLHAKGRWTLRQCAVFGRQGAASAARRRSSRRLRGDCAAAKSGGIARGGWSVGLELSRQTAGHCRR
jgi:hypothetical protein